MTDTFAFTSLVDRFILIIHLAIRYLINKERFDAWHLEFWYAGDEMRSQTLDRILHAFVDSALVTFTYFYILSCNIKNIINTRSVVKFLLSTKKYQMKNQYCGSSRIHLGITHFIISTQATIFNIRICNDCIVLLTYYYNI